MKQKSLGILILSLFCIFLNTKIYGQGIGLVDVKYAEKIITLGGADAGSIFQQVLEIAFERQHDFVRLGARIELGVSRQINDSGGTINRTENTAVGTQARV